MSAISSSSVRLRSRMRVRGMRTVFVGFAEPGGGHRAGEVRVRVPVGFDAERHAPVTGGGMRRPGCPALPGRPPLSTWARGECRPGPGREAAVCGPAAARQPTVVPPSTRSTRSTDQPCAALVCPQPHSCCGCPWNRVDVIRPTGRGQYRAQQQESWLKPYTNALNAEAPERRWALRGFGTGRLRSAAQLLRA